MALPQDGQNANALATVKEVPTGKKLIFVDPTTNEGGIITLEDLTTQILKKLTSQTFALDQGTKTLPAALNELNSKRLTAYARGTYDEVKINANGYALLTKDGIDLSECKFATMVCPQLYHRLMLQDQMFSRNLHLLMQLQKAMRMQQNRKLLIPHRRQQKSC